MINKEEIRKLATQIGIAFGAESVILFGSHARGTEEKDSDVDLLIIAESSLPRFKRSREIYRTIHPYPFAVDLVVYTPEEIERGKRTPVSFVSRILQEGEVLYDRRDSDRKTVAG